MKFLPQNLNLTVQGPSGHDNLADMRWEWQRKRWAPARSLWLQADDHPDPGAQCPRWPLWTSGDVRGRRARQPDHRGEPGLRIGEPDGRSRRSPPLTPPTSRSWAGIWSARYRKNGFQRLFWMLAPRSHRLRCSNSSPTRRWSPLPNMG